MSGHMHEVDEHHEDPRALIQTGSFYCSGCGRKFRYDYDDNAHCQTSGCPFEGLTAVGEKGKVK